VLLTYSNSIQHMISWPVIKNGDGEVSAYWIQWIAHLRGSPQKSTHGVVTERLAMATR